MTLEITHLSPGTLNHIQSVLENTHYHKPVEIVRIWEEDGKKWVEYEVLDLIEHYADTWTALKDK